MKHIPLSPLKREPRAYEFVALDVEGDGTPNGFMLAVTFDDDGPHVFHSKKQLREWLFQKRNLGKIILCANLEYDYAVSFQPFDEHFSILMNHGAWLHADYHDLSKHTWHAWDIQRIAPLSVAEMGDIVGLPKFDTPPSLTTRRLSSDTVWTCAIHKRDYCVECYCARDAEIVFRFAHQYQNQLNALGGQLHMTAASCAMDLFRRTYLDRVIWPTWEENNLLARECYYGGRAECYRVGTVFDVNAYDVTSNYPSVMRDLEVGLPNTYHRIHAPQNPCWYLDKFGQFYGELEMPASFVPTMPARVNSRLFFPYGRLRGSWTLSEVLFALQHGARIKNCDWILYADETIKPFTRYVDELFKLRQEYHAKEDKNEVVIKLLLNSLYGKFGQRSDSGLQRLIVPPQHYRLRDYDGCEVVKLAGYECFMEDIQPFVQSPHVHVLWAAEITARGRMRLANLLMENETEAIYCDTDCIHTLAVLETGTALGDLRSQYRFQRSTYFAPKEYAGYTSGGEFIARAKGIPAPNASDYLARGHTTFTQPLHTLEAIRTGGRIAAWRTIVKSRRSNPCNRQHQPLSDYNQPSVTTFPFSIDHETLRCEANWSC